MNNLHISNYEYKAREYAREMHINIEKQAHFLAGVKWAFEAILHTMRHAGHPMASDSDNARMRDLAWKDVKKAIAKLMEKTIAPDQPTQDESNE